MDYSQLYSGDASTMVDQAAAPEPERELPQPPSAGTSGPGGAERALPDVCDPEVLASLKKIYEEHVPEKSEEEVGGIIAKYAGREAVLLVKVQKKYLGIAPPAAPPAAAGPQPQRIDVTAPEGSKSYGAIAKYRILWSDESGVVHEARRRYSEFYALRSNLLSSSMVSFMHKSRLSTRKNEDSSLENEDSSLEKW